MWRRRRMRMRRGFAFAVVAVAVSVAVLVAVSLAVAVAVAVSVTASDAVSVAVAVSAALSVAVAVSVVVSVAVSVAVAGPWIFSFVPQRRVITRHRPRTSRLNVNAAVGRRSLRQADSAVEHVHLRVVGDSGEVAELRRAFGVGGVKIRAARCHDRVGRTHLEVGRNSAVPFTTDFNMPEARLTRVGVAPPAVYWSSVIVVEGLSSSLLRSVRMMTPCPSAPETI